MLSPTIIIVIALFMMGMGGGFLYIIVGERGRPQGALEWAGALLSSLVVVCGGALLLLATSTNEMDVGTGAARQGVGDTASNFSFRLVDNDKQRTLDNYDGKVVLVNFWATWCAPCREEMPDLSRLQEDYGSEGLRVLTISDETRPTLQEFEHDPPLKTTNGYLRNPAKLPEPFDEMQDGRPVSFLIDREGRIQGQYIGAQSYQFFEQALTPYL